MEHDGAEFGPGERRVVDRKVMLVLELPDSEDGNDPTNEKPGGKSMPEMSKVPAA